MRIALTADLHWGTRHTEGNRATEALADRLRAEVPDLLIIAGDIGTEDLFDQCLDLFAELPCPKALVPGNHDIWVQPEDDPRGDSLAVYQTHLPAISSRYGFHYLDHGPMYFPEADLAIVGTMNWYDYSWSLDQLKEATPDWESRLQSKRFSRGKHNDGNFVRWPLDDIEFTRDILQTFESHLREALDLASQAIIIAHHPPCRGLNYPTSDEDLDLDTLLWRAFSGNVAMEQVLQRHADRIARIFCGHTHFARESEFHGIPGHNIGGDYTFKRLLWLDWLTGMVRAEEFGGE